MKLYDAHTHLNHEELFPNWEQLLTDFQEQGGTGLVNIGANQHYNTNGLTISHQALTSHPQLRVKASIGIHPCDVQNASLHADSEITLLKKQIKDNDLYIVAIGECGIDLYYPGASDFLDIQKEFFFKQCILARELNLPIIIHSRNAFDETIAILNNFKDLKIYFHCWSYGEQELSYLLGNFPQLWIGFTGIFTFPKSKENRNCLKLTPINQLLLETDAPYLAPQGFRGKINSPALIKVIGEQASSILNIPQEQLWNQVEKNFSKLYKEGQLNKK